MSTQFRSDRKYMMPHHFGPSCGPRQGADGSRFIDKGWTDCTTYEVRFVTDARMLAPLVSNRCRLRGEPVVSIELACLQNIPWLAGRGYRVLSVRVPVSVEVSGAPVHGQFLSVLWEDLADPILTGREQLGYPKLFADIPEPTRTGSRVAATASWMGFCFATLEFEVGSSLGNQVGGVDGSLGDGLIAHKYVPRTGSGWSRADADYLTFLPHAGIRPPAAAPLPEAWEAKGSVRFREARWEDMPTQYHVVNALARLPVIEPRPGMMRRAPVSEDLHEIRILQ